MLSNSPAMAYLGVSDLEAGKAFYEGVLGLPVVWQNEFAVVVEAGGVKVWLTKPPQVVAAGYTVLGFQVSDVAAKAGELRAKGVTFERYPWFGDSQDADGIWTAPSGTKVAWFKDPDGNLLSISNPD